MSEPIISVSGLRGIVGQSLTPDRIVRYVSAFAAELPHGVVVLGRDSRVSGPWIARLIAGTLAATGRHVLDAGIASTPTIGVLVDHLQAAGGIQISASHNPPEYNGLKLFNQEGRVIPARAGQLVLKRYVANDYGAVWAPVSRTGDVTVMEDPHAVHLARVLACVDVDKIRSKAFRVLLDANHGAGALLGRRLLDALGCQATVLGAAPDGQFAHPPEPTAENLAGLKSLPARFDVGFCQDPDADRLALLDADGDYLGEEYTVALCAKHVLSQRPGPVVINCATSRMTDDVAASIPGSTCFRSAVGEANVVDRMLAEKAVFGGEGNGGPIDPRVGWVRDSFVGMALILERMAESGKSLRELAAELPAYAILKSKLSLPAEAVKPAIARLIAAHPEASASELDGLRLDWPDGWLLFRPSNTEPIVRIIAEFPTEARCAEVCEKAAAIVTAA